MAAGKIEDTAVQIKRTFNASRERCFNAWTQIDEIVQWFAPTDVYETIVDELDVCEGGNYRIIMKHPNGNHTVTGKYLQVQPPSKLVYTWRWEEKAPYNISQVTVDFHQKGNQTEVVLTHERLVDQKDREEHSHGWTLCFDRLGSFLENAH